MKWRRFGGVDDVLNLLSWLAATVVLLMLVGCAMGQGPPSTAPSPRDNGADMRM